MHAYSPQKCIWTRACAPMQRCRSFFMEAIANLSWVLREHRAGCRLPPAILPTPQNQSPDAVCSRNPSKSTLDHNAVAAEVTVLHKHYLIIRVGAGLIRFFHRSHSHLATGVSSSRNLFWPFFRASFFCFVFICSTFIVSFPSHSLCVCVCCFVLLTRGWEWLEKKRGLQLPWDLLQYSPLWLCR